jgi:predicted glycosyltransferase
MTGTRVLYISGSTGLGHARTDLAIARELRRLDPEVEIMWLAESGYRRSRGAACRERRAASLPVSYVGLADIQRRPALVV